MFDKLGTSSLKIRIVALESLLVHEGDDPYRVKRLIMQLSRDGKLRNPIIVAQQGSHYVVLDGATRTSALHEMGIRDALVQIVDYNTDTVKLRTWHHVIVGLAPSRLMARLAEIDGITFKSIEDFQALSLLENRKIEADIILNNGQHFAVNCVGDLDCQLDLLCELVEIYRGKAEVHRVTENDLFSLIKEYPDLSAVIAFPTFLPGEILQMAINGTKFPMGITRHIILGRALGLNVPLNKLKSSQSLDAKNAWLEDKIRQLVRTNKIRLYQEPVFIFDE